MGGPPRPIGYWLRRADQLLTARIDQAQRATGLTRLEWQLLNVVRKAGPGTLESAAGALKPFADADTVETAVASLEARGLLRRETAGLALTREGEDLFAKALAVQTSVRSEAMQGISEADYESTMRVLQRLVANLERLVDTQSESASERSDA